LQYIYKGGSNVKIQNEFVEAVSNIIKMFYS
jgi:hypothetical protein